MGRLRQVAVSGLIIVAPITITIIAVVGLLQAIADLSIVAVIEPAYLRPPVAIILFVGLALGLGYFTRTAVGAVMVGWVTQGINHVPALRVVYNASQLAVETVLTDKTEKSEPVMIEAWKGLRVTAFTTGKRTADGRLICFFPTAPNITTGYVIEVKEEDVIRTGESIEHALTRLLSAGFGENENGRGRELVGGNARYVRGVEIDPID